MAIALSSAQTWAHESTLYNIRSVDAAVRSDGTIALAYAGSDNSMNGLLALGTLNTTTGQLGGVVVASYAQATGGAPFAAIGPIDLEAGPGGRVSVQMRMNEAGLTNDTNAALLIQRFQNGALAGDAVPVNPATPTDITSAYSALVYGGKGDFAVFFTEQVGSNLSNGIRMATFSANGTAQGGPVTVIADHPAGGLVSVDANPIMVDAVAMKGGGYGLVWTESSAFQAPTYGQPRVMFQALDATGTAIGTALEIDGTSAQRAQIVALESGRMAVVWLDYSLGDQGVFKGQILSSAGAKIGGVFDISSSLSTQEGDMSLAATECGGFAVVWRDVTNQTFLGRMFNSNGEAKGNDFAILDTAGQFIGATAGLVAQGGTVYTWLHGLNGTVGSGFVLQGQAFSTAASWGVKLRDTAGTGVLAGAGLDDILSGLGGRDRITGQGGNDILSGDAGNDRISGGAGIDEITGGTGRDQLSGGLGADALVFLSAAEGGDTISDFAGAEGDRLVFSKAGFGGASAVLSGATVNTAHAGLFFNTTTGELTYDSDGSGAAARQLIVTLTGVTSLAFDDSLFLA